MDFLFEKRQNDAFQTNGKIALDKTSNNLKYNNISNFSERKTDLVGVEDMSSIVQCGEFVKQLNRNSETTVENKASLHIFSPVKSFESSFLENNILETSTRQCISKNEEWLKKVNILKQKVIDEEDTKVDKIETTVEFKKSSDSFIPFPNENICSFYEQNADSLFSLKYNAIDKTSENLYKSKMYCLFDENDTNHDFSVLPGKSFSAPDVLLSEKVESTPVKDNIRRRILSFPGDSSERPSSLLEESIEVLNDLVDIKVLEKCNNYSLVTESSNQPVINDLVCVNNINAAEFSNDPCQGVFSLKEDQSALIFKKQEHVTNFKRPSFHFEEQDQCRFSNKQALFNANDMQDNSRLSQKKDQFIQPISKTNECLSFKNSTSDPENIHYQSLPVANPISRLINQMPNQNISVLPCQNISVLPCQDITLIPHQEVSIKYIKASNNVPSLNILGQSERITLLAERRAIIRNTETFTLRNISSNMYSDFIDLSDSPYSFVQHPTFYYLGPYYKDTYTSEWHNVLNDFQNLKIRESDNGPVSFSLMKRNKGITLNIREVNTQKKKNICKKNALQGCKFCKSNCESRDMYTNHELKQKIGKRTIISCPVLRRLVCERCGSTGDNAHTRSYCPVVIAENGQKPISVANEIKKTRRFASGKIRKFNN